MITGCQACLVDVEGTLIRCKSGAPVDGAVDWLCELHDRGFPTLLVTNSTTHSSDELAEELRGLGFRVRAEEILSCLETGSALLRSYGVRSAMIVGSNRLRRFFAESGLLIEEHPDVDAVVVGLDLELTYEKLTLPTLALERNARLVALHENPLYRPHDGLPRPGVGAVVRALEYATGRAAVVAGKPSTYFFRQALQRVGSAPGETIMISDDPLSDLRGARQVGLRTAFVLSGKYAEPVVLERLPPGDRPEEILSSVGEVRFWDERG